MENFEIARTLKELGLLLEIQGANAFRVRAYRNAVEAIGGLTRPLSDMVEAGEDLTALQDIGKTVASHIEELVKTGNLARLDEVSAEIPRELTKLVQLDGVGPKKAKKLWEELGVVTMDDLEAAVKGGKVQLLEGFGPKSATRILTAIESFRRRTGRMLLSEAEQVLEPLTAYVLEAEGVERLEVAGSYRRRKETIGDLDLLVQTSGDGGAIIQHFVDYPGVDRVTGAGDTKGSVVLRSGISVDLRVLPPRSFGAALQYFTGSKEHNVAVRILGVKAGLRLNEWGVFRIPDDVDSSDVGKEDGERLGGTTEEEMYAPLDLPWIPPVLRENRGEIDAARAGTLPSLVSVEDVQAELHMHSTWSDGRLSIAEMVQECKERGFHYGVITDHTPAVGVAGGLDPERVRDQWAEIDNLRSTLSDFKLFRGLEVDILKDGSLDTTDEVLEGLDFVIISVHSFMDMDKATMTDRVIRALAHPAVDLLAHPTGRLLNRREGYPIDVEAVLQAALERNVAVEINAHPRRLDLSDVHAYRARELGVMIAINTDAHSAKDLKNLKYGVDQGRRAWLQTSNVLNTKTVDEFEDWLGRKDQG